MSEPRATNDRLAERLMKLAQKDGVLAIPGLQAGLLDAACILTSKAPPSETRDTIIEECVIVLKSMRPVISKNPTLQVQRDTLDNAVRLLHALKNAAPQVLKIREIMHPGKDTESPPSVEEWPRSAVAGNTPRTNEQLGLVPDAGPEYYGMLEAQDPWPQYKALADFARQLERELADHKAIVAALTKTLDVAQSDAKVREALRSSVAAPSLPEEIPPGLITATGTVLSAYTAKLVWKRWREVLLAEAPRSATRAPHERGLEIEVVAKALCRLAYPSRSLDEALGAGNVLWMRLIPEAEAALQGLDSLKWQPHDL